MLDWLLIMIPAYVANMIPILARRIPWNVPVDFGMSFNNKRLLGSNKTWKGLVLGVSAGTFSGWLIANSYWPIAVHPLLWSFFVSLGALLGDLVKSFFKRRLNIKSGKSWFPFDQVDFSIGALALGSFVFFPGWSAAIFIVTVSALGHIGVNHLAYFTGIRGEKW
ncbi:CDP-archaeol synthase [Candidatus Woesearchaeota archaeon]|nr:CDP-archaeol synthase [Candidatus Woesearchaeota archaeon]